MRRKFLDQLLYRSVKGIVVEMTQLAYSTKLPTFDICQEPRLEYSQVKWCRPISS